MNGLQRAIEEPKREELLWSHRFSTVGSVGIVALSGLTPSYISFAPTVSEFASPLLAISSLRRAPAVVVGYRSREIEWRRTHADDLQAFANEWVALEGEQIVAHGPDPMEVVAEARARGIQTPYIFYVESLDESIVKMGL